MLTAVCHSARFATADNGFADGRRNRGTFDAVTNGPFAIASMDGGGKGRTPPRLCSLASLRISYGGGFTCSTSVALGLVRDLCRGGCAACPHMSARFLASSVCPGYPRVLGNIDRTGVTDRRGCLPLVRRLTTANGGLPGDGGMFSGDGIASRRTVVPANIPPAKLASVRTGICSLVTGQFVDIFCPSYGFSAAAMLNRIVGRSKPGPRGVRFGIDNGRVLRPN